ncbi:hypothetical protein [Maribacter sp. IgM3_T14_3]|jgi:hypothetical protein|uniref:hypothetical protein n=1 Tax=Maribacter sp. IgM3_T14_3 TaxID=3415140 RepID=UPI003C6FCC30
MSVVSNVILSFSVGEDESQRMKDVNEFDINGNKINLVSADFQRKENYEAKAWYGGSKYLEKPLYIGAYNNLNLNAFIDHLKTIIWDEPENVQLIINEQNEDLFKVVRLT